MASSISPPTLSPPHTSFSSPTTSHKQVSFTSPRFTKHRCHSSSSSDSPSRWDSAIRNVVSNVVRTFDRFINSNSYSDRCSNESDGGWGVEDRDEDVDDVWDWGRWSQHFDRVDEQERIVSILKLQLNHAVNREDYEGAARLKVAIAAAATNDTVGRVISMLNRAIEEERYKDASLIRDYAGTGLVGWWSGIIEGTNDPFGRIIRITAEHGRYVARSYNPRQLATATSGVPLFEIFLTTDKKGEYKQQAVHLKRKRASEDFKIISSISSITTTTATRGLNTIDSNDESDLVALNIEDIEDNDDRDDDSDVVEGLSGFQNILRDMIPGVKVKVLKVSAPGKVSRDMISKVIEHIMDEEDEDDAEEKDFDLESLGTEDEDDAKDDNQRKQKIGMEAGEEIRDSEQEYGITVKFDEALVQKLSSSIPFKDLLRVPAKLEKKGRLSFSFSIEKDETKQDFSDKKRVSANKKGKLPGERNADHAMLDLAKVIGTEKIPLKVIKDINELIRFTLTQAQNYQPLTDSTTFKRLELPASPDPLNGFYIGAHGLYVSEVIQLRRKFGQWQGDGGTSESSNLEFYEYVEATKLTGDSYIPAGQVSFRAKVGKKYQLPHKGIIPDDFGVIARYKGQGRLPKPGFRNPRWVDGELVILDGKYIKGGPVVGFVYWDPEYHFLVFFNRLTLQE